MSKVSTPESIITVQLYNIYIYLYPTIIYQYSYILSPGCVFFMFDIYIFFLSLSLLITQYNLLTFLTMSVTKICGVTTHLSCISWAVLINLIIWCRCYYVKKQFVLVISVKKKKSKFVAYTKLKQNDH